MYKKLNKPKILHVFDKTLVLSTIFENYGSEDQEKLLKKKNQMRY